MLLLRFLGDMSLPPVTSLTQLAICMFKGKSTLVLMTIAFSSGIVCSLWQPDSCKTILVQPLVAQDPQADGNLSSKEFLHETLLNSDVNLADAMRQRKTTMMT